MYIGSEIPDIKSVAPTGIIKRGDKGLAVKLVQEWLTLHGYSTGIDGDFGQATQWAIKEFQASKRLTLDCIIGRVTWGMLWLPMKYCLWDSLGKPGSTARHWDISKFALTNADRFLRNNAHELSQNRGPWIRLFFSKDPVNGLDGPAFSWCGSFVGFCIYQALILLKHKSNTVWGYKTGWSVDNTAQWAIKNGLFYEQANPDTVTPGSIFLIRKSENDWVHMGFVEGYDYNEGVITTIEGNSNESGSVNGTRVVRRYRSVKNLNFITGYGSAKDVRGSTRTLRRTGRTDVR